MPGREASTTNAVIPPRWCSDDGTTAITHEQVRDTPFVVQSLVPLRTKADAVVGGRCRRAHAAGSLPTSGSVRRKAPISSFGDARLGIARLLLVCSETTSGFPLTSHSNSGVTHPIRSARQKNSKLDFVRIRNVIMAFCV